MNAKFIFASLLGMFLLTPITTRLEAASSIKIVKNDSNLQKTLASINDNELVYFDATFKTVMVANSTQCSQGQFGPLAHSDNFEFQIKPDVNNNHLLMTIIPGSKNQFPYNAVSCPYNGSTPAATFIRFRGFYIALHYAIPTANLIEFRPVNIPLDKANHALQK